MNQSDDSSLIDELIAKGEDQTVDFKKRDILSNSKKLATLMVAFANTNGGRILVGVCEDGSIEGMREKKEHETHVMNVARENCTPPLNPRFSVIRKSEGDVYVIKVLRYQKFPHAVATREGNVYFIRVGSTVREASPSELVILFEATREEVVSKRPELELLLVDDKGNATKEIHAQPTIVKKKILKRPIQTLSPTSASMVELSRQIRVLNSQSIFFGAKEPSKDLVPIGIQITNVGEIPAQGIRVFLRFPKECELVSENDAVGGLANLIKPPSVSSGGLFVDKDDREADAYIDTLGNDLTMRHFKKAYARFPEKEQQCKVEARITQYGFPPKDFEFLIIVKPKIVEEVEYVYNEKS